MEMEESHEPYNLVPYLTEKWDTNDDMLLPDFFQ